MELKEFVKEALIQIAQGISGAQSDLSESGCVINPRVVISSEHKTQLNNKLHTIQYVDFEIALTEGKASDDKVGIDVALGPFRAGGNKHFNNENASKTSVSFSIPVAFPSVDNENNENKSHAYAVVAPSSNRRSHRY
jgi:hypothetical protein